VNAGFTLLVLDLLELVACTHTEGKYLLAFLTLLLSLTQILQGYVCAVVAFPWSGFPSLLAIFDRKMTFFVHFNEK